VEDWARPWLDAQASLKPSTRYGYRSLLGKHVLPVWGRHRLTDVTHEDVAKWTAALVGKGLGPSTVRQTHRFFWLCTHLRSPRRADPAQPRRGSASAQVTRGEPRFLTRGEVEGLAAAAGEYADVIQLLAWPTQGSGWENWRRYGCAGWTLIGAGSRSPRVPRTLPVLPTSAPRRLIWNAPCLFLRR